MALEQHLAKASLRAPTAARRVSPPGSGKSTTGRSRNCIDKKPTSIQNDGMNSSGGLVKNDKGVGLVFRRLGCLALLGGIVAAGWTAGRAADTSDYRGGSQQKGSPRPGSTRKTKPAEPPVFSPIPSGGSFSITNPIIIITPAKLDFGFVPEGRSATNTFLVENAGHGKLSGTASVAAPFKIESGGKFTLKESEAQVVTVSYTPKDDRVDTAPVIFTAGETTVKATVIGRRLHRRD